MTTIWEKTWTLKDGPDEIYIPPNDTVFEIKFDKFTGFFKIDLISAHVDPRWENARLLERGRKPMEWPDHMRLSPWPAHPSNADRKKYQDTIETVLRKYASSDTLRLEGDVEFGIGPNLHVKRATILIASDAVEDGQHNLYPLFLVNVSSKLFGTGGPIDDGTAHGNN